MSSSYTSIFGGGVISAAYPSYNLFALTALAPQINLVWPSEFVSSPNYTSEIVEFTATAGGQSFVMPPANIVSVGQASLFTNLSAYTVTLYANDGSTVITTFSAATSTYVYLINNTTTNGLFRVIPWATGTPSIVNINAVSLNADLTVTGGPITSSGTFTFNLAGDILALSQLSGTGVAVRTGSNTWTTRTITGTSNQITVVNGSGVSGNPTISLPSAVSGITSLTASNIQIGVNGTNIINTADNNPLIVNAPLSLTPISGVASAHRWYAADGVHYLSFQGPASAVANVTWTLPSADATIPGQVLSSNAAGVLSWTTSAGGTVNSVTGTTGQITAAPTSGAVVLSLAATAVAAGSYTNTNLTVDAFGRITAAANGATGTGAALTNTVGQMSHGFTVGQVLYYNGSSYALAKADSAATAEALGIVTTVINPNSFILTGAGYVPTSAGIVGLTAGNVYWLSDITGGLLTSTEPSTVAHIQKPMFVADSTTSGYVINYRGDIVPAPTNLVNNINWIQAASTPITMVPNTAYSINNGVTQVVLNMPATVPFGSVFIVCGGSSGGWQIQMNTGQTLHIAASSTTSGGTLTSAAQYNAASFICSIDNTTFTGYAATAGSPTFA